MKEGNTVCGSFGTRMEFCRVRWNIMKERNGRSRNERLSISRFSISPVVTQDFKTLLSQAAENPLDST